MILYSKPIHPRRRGAFLLAAGLTAIFFFGGCSLGPGFSGEAVSPEINLKGLSSDVSSVDVRVTGPGIDRSYTVTPSTTRLAIELPQAQDVRFEVEAPNDNVGYGAVYSWGMARYADLVAGETTEIDFVMGPFDNKILVPDQSNSRIVQVANLGLNQSFSGDPNIIFGSDWIESDADAVFGYVDVQLDNQGRVWMSSGADGEIFMWDRMGLGIGDAILSGEFGAGLAFDRFNSAMYHLYSGQSNYVIGRFQVQAGSTPVGSKQTFDIVQEPEITALSFGTQHALTIDRKGNLYFFGEDTFSRTVLYKYDPSRSVGNRVVDSYHNSNWNYSDFQVDLIYKDRHIFIVSPGGNPGGGAIIKLTPDFRIVDSFGTISPSASNPGEFFNPVRFISSSNEEFFVIDDGTATGENRIVRFDNIEGDNWKAFNPQNDTGDEFSFYQ